MSTVLLIEISRDEFVYSASLFMKVISKGWKTPIQLLNRLSEQFGQNPRTFSDQFCGRTCWLLTVKNGIIRGNKEPGTFLSDSRILWRKQSKEIVRLANRVEWSRILDQYGATG